MTDRDPLTIAHELLEIGTSAIGGNIVVDGVDVLETTRNAQKVARAAIATAAALDDLGDLLDDASTWGPDDEERMLPKLHAIRARIHAALNGANDD